MNFLFPSGPALKDQTQSRLLFLAAVFLILYAVILTLAPGVRLHSWQVDYRWTHWIGYIVWLVGFVVLHRLSIARLVDRDPYLLPVMAIISGWGLLTIWRLNTDFGMRQTLWFGLSFIAFGLIIARPSVLHLLRRYKYIWLTGGLVLTALTFLIGTYPGGDGPRLWLGCCGIYLQPSEPLKLLLVIYLAAYLADRSLFNTSLLSLLFPTLVLMAAALVLLVGQRDLGTASLFIAIYSVIVFLASGKKRLLVSSLILILLASVVGYQLFNVIQVRIAAWINPWIDPSGHSYQIIQSLLAVASGGMIGNGPGIGNPSVVPVAQSDFIFAAISEETGLVGTIGLIILLGILAIRGIVVALRAANNYQRFLAAGISVNLIAQSILIIAGNLRLLPLTGVTLPFISYGGSSLLSSFLAVSLLMLISNHPDEDVAPLPNPQPYLITGGFLLIGLLAVGSINIYWGLIRSDDLLQRADNPRWSITDRYVARGRILDRNNQPIVISTGTPGNYERTLLVPALGPIIGYSNPLYGQAGLEASLDTYLRGLQDNSSSTITYYHLVYGQTPPGLDVRLSLDLRAQQQADTLLSNRSGAMVLLNSQTGEILVMSSHPGFDPNQLDANWNQWIKDPRSVFLNRATQGQYSPGAALGPFLLAFVLSQEILPPLPSSSSLLFDGANWNCALPESAKPTWGESISHGCPGAANALAQRIRSDQLTQLLHQIGLDRTPEISIPTAPAHTIQNQDDATRLALGEGNLLVSPLQMALAATTLNPQGKIPAVRIASAADSPLQGWLVLPGPAAPVLPILSSRNDTAKLLQINDLPIWEITATAHTAQGKITWYLGGTISDWKGAPLAIAIVLENDDPNYAQKIGEEMLRMMLVP